MDLHAQLSDPATVTYSGSSAHSGQLHLRCRRQPDLDDATAPVPRPTPMTRSASSPLPPTAPARPPATATTPTATSPASPTRCRASPAWATTQHRRLQLRQRRPADSRSPTSTATRSPSPTTPTACPTCRNPRHHRRHHHHHLRPYRQPVSHQPSSQQHHHAAVASAMPTRPAGNIITETDTPSSHADHPRPTVTTRRAGWYRHDARRHHPTAPPRTASTPAATSPTSARPVPPALSTTTTASSPPPHCGGATQNQLHLQRPRSSGLPLKQGLTTSRVRHLERGLPSSPAYTTGTPAMSAINLRRQRPARLSHDRRRTPPISPGTSVQDTPQLLTDSANAYIYVGHSAHQPSRSAYATGTVTYLSTDSLGSVRGTISSAGALTSTTSYDAWGNPQTARRPHQPPPRSATP